MESLKLSPVRLLSDARSHRLTLEEQGFLLQAVARLALFDGSLSTTDPGGIHDEMRPRLQRRKFDTLWARCLPLLQSYEADIQHQARGQAAKSSVRRAAASARWEGRRGDANAYANAHSIKDANAYANALTGGDANASKEREERKAEKVSPRTPLQREESKEEKEGSFARMFDTFWRAYPRRVGKGDALRSFRRLRVDDALLGQMLAALTWQRTQDQWTKDEGKFIPHPSTWLNQRRWEDERIPSASSASEDDQDDGPYYPSLRDYRPGGVTR